MKNILTHLNNTGLAAKDNPLYQVIKEIIDELEPDEITAITVSKFAFLTPVLFVGLPALSKVGTLAVISDSTTVVWGAIIAGSGANTVLAWFNGTDWTVVGI